MTGQCKRVITYDCEAAGTHAVFKNEKGGKVVLYRKGDSQNSFLFDREHLDDVIEALLQLQAALAEDEGPTANKGDFIRMAE